MSGCGSCLLITHVYTALQLCLFERVGLCLRTLAEQEPVDGYTQPSTHIAPYQMNLPGVTLVNAEAQKKTGPQADVDEVSRPPCACTCRVGSPRCCSLQYSAGRHLPLDWCMKQRPCIHLARLTILH
jgi:hypothetical protein